MTITEDRPLTVDTNTGNHDRFAHYVTKEELAKGGECRALCGKKWIPRYRDDADVFPKCPDCLEIYNRLKGA